MLTKPRVPAKMPGNSVTTRKKRRLSPLMLIGICVSVLLALIGVGIFAILPRISSHAAATPNPNCTLIVPPNPLTAQGLATPYQLTATDPANGPCNEANANQSAFVQADILNPATGQITTYDPLVIDKGTQPAIQPVAPQLPRNAVVAIWFGDNGTTLTLLKTNARQHNRGRGGRFSFGQFFHIGLRGGTNGNCVNGLPDSPFGQFGYCNAPAFFQVANFLIAIHKITVPPLGTAADGLPCPTTRDFSIVDMDQSDNVQTQYLANGNGQTAQFSTANQNQLQNATTISNPSDNALLSHFVDPALGCKAWQVPDIVNNNTPAATYGTDELQAAHEQRAPVALVPAGDEMTLVNGNPSLAKVNLYRAGAGQPFATTLNGTGTTSASTTAYCQNLINVALPRLQRDMTLFQNQPSPDGGATATTLFGFLANRLNATLSANGLNCVGLLNIQNPVTLTTDGNGVVTAATITTRPLPANNNTGTTGTTTTTTTPTATATTTTTGTGTTTGTTTTGNGNANQNPLPFNNKGISDDNSRTQANFDGVGSSYSAQALQNAGITPGNSVTFNGVTFTWPSAASGQPDNVLAHGQVIPVTAANGATTLAFLGSASFGPSIGTATVTYTDGTRQTFSMVFSDWVLNNGASKPASGDQIVATLPYSNTPHGMLSWQKPDVFYTDVTLEPGKTVKSVTLPTHTTQGQIHIFAIATK
jgi:hypothetical protein